MKSCLLYSEAMFNIMYEMSKVKIHQHQFIVEILSWYDNTRVLLSYTRTNLFKICFSIHVFTLRLQWVKTVHLTANLINVENLIKIVNSIKRMVKNETKRR